MNRMDRIFSKNLAKGRGSLVCYFPICDPILDDDVAWAGKYFSCGCDVLEVGLPYQNPRYDGPTVADSMRRALSRTDLNGIFRRIRDIRDAYPENIIQVMTYYENVQHYGFEGFAAKCGEAGVDGVLCANLPIDKMQIFDETLGRYGIYNCRFALYHLTDEAVDDLASHARGYIFLQAVDGATGARVDVDPKLADHVRFLKDKNVPAPVFSGFGISTSDHVVKHMQAGSDGVIVGSSTISHIIAGDAEAYIRELAANLTVKMSI